MRPLQKRVSSVTNEENKTKQNKTKTTASACAIVVGYSKLQLLLDGVKMSAHRLAAGLQTIGIVD